MIRILQPAIWLIIACLCGWKIFTSLPSADSDGWPARPIHVVVPYSAGGGTDSFVRLMTKSIEDNQRLPQPLVIINQPGGSGTIGSRYVKDARPDGYRILCHHESLITTQLSGTVPFGPADFDLIARTGTVHLVVVVREDAPWKSVTELLNDAKAEPGTLRFGANAGSPAHFTARQLEAAVPGARFNLITSGGGQKRYIELIGGHLEAGIFSLAEYLSFVSEEGTPADKNIRALVSLSEKTPAALGTTSTCLKEGIEVTSGNAYYWLAPQDTPESVKDNLRSALKQTMQDTEVIGALKKWSIERNYLDGVELNDRMVARMNELAPLAEQSEADLPDFPFWAGTLCVVLAIVIVLAGRTDQKESRTAPLRHTAAIGCLLIVSVWVLLLEKTDLPFAVTTAVTVFAVGQLISGQKKVDTRTLIQTALLTALGIEFVFTVLFTVALP